MATDKRIEQAETALVEMSRIAADISEVDPRLMIGVAGSLLLGALRTYVHFTQDRAFADDNARHFARLLIKFTEES